MGNNDTKLEKQLGEDPPGEVEHYFGFENFGNTCYCNSVLQALYFCTPFRAAINNWKSNRIIEQQLLEQSQNKTSKTSTSSILNTLGIFSKKDGNSNSLLSELSNLFEEIQSQKRKTGTIRPSPFISTLRKENEIFRSNMQQDAHEFLMFLLNELSEIMEKERKSNEKQNSNLATSNIGNTNNSNNNSTKTLVQSIFQGTFTNQTRCLTCESISSRDEHFLDIPVDIEQNSSITHCLNKFSKIERLGGSNKFFCENCRGLQEAEKSTKFKALPKILILHLKRFKYLEHLERHTKLSHRVTFPLELRIPSIISPSSKSSPADSTSQTNDLDMNTSINDLYDYDPLYYLMAIVVHIGATANSGHYVAIVRIREKWILFDDERVQPLSDSESILNKCYGMWNHDPEVPQNTAAGYILFYERRQELGHLMPQM